MSDRFNCRWAYWLRPNRNWTWNCVTLGSVSYYSCSEDYLPAPVLAATRAHEKVHQEQWAKWKILYLPKYMIEIYLFGYKDSPSEREARNAAGQE